MKQHLGSLRATDLCCLGFFDRYLFDLLRRLRWAVSYHLAFQVRKPSRTLTVEINCCPSTELDAVMQGTLIGIVNAPLPSAHMFIHRSHGATGDRPQLLNHSKPLPPATSLGRPF
ncbi:uncharacterized protein ARMOST_21547 [Armillaria ostoyae]|uniref:Uncharacterized protein n=1 Tax=Armillaria ostoyae TaxID=47428 RepID=A0A284SAG9_ARMOS|nr:uncharacterized protein ARMOST_21547 [Armillaria ostoyae]